MSTTSAWVMALTAPGDFTASFVISISGNMFIIEIGL
jgi:hypothetical protein